MEDTKPPKKGSSTDLRHALVLYRIGAAWDKRPDLRLGQLILDAVYSEAPLEPAGALLGMDDQRLAESVERFVLKKPKPSMPPR